MATTGQPPSAAVASDDDARLQALGYTPQLNRVLGLFANFSVAFTYLSPMVGIYSLFALGVGTGGPAYLWLTLVPGGGVVFPVPPLAPGGGDVFGGAGLRRAREPLSRRGRALPVLEVLGRRGLRV